MSAISKTVPVKVSGITEKDIQDKARSLQILASNLNRDSLVILANKSGKVGIDSTIKQYESFM